MALVSPAETVDENRARKAAASYVSRNYAPSAIAKAVKRLPASAALTVSAVRPLTGAAGVIGFVAELSPSGFAVLRADDDLPPLKMHSATGAYEALPPGFRAVVEAELAGELMDLAGARRTKSVPDTRRRLEWQALSETQALDVEALSLASAPLSVNAGAVLLTTTWSQGDPYNTYSPVTAGGPGGRAVVGCGPLALAQILRYHKKPARPVQDVVDTDSSGPLTGTYALSDVGGLEPYDWANMPDAITVSSPLAQRQAVGRLNYHCGVALQADFEATGTSVGSQYYTAYAFREVFGYTCEDYQFRSDYSTESWLAKIQSDIDASRPVYYTMASTLGGHVVVCDGYRNGTEVHLNFGSSGYGDAWYNIDSVVFYGRLWGWHEGVFGITPPAASATNTLTVVNGTGSGAYLAGAALEVVANLPADGYSFTRWSVSPQGAELGPEFVATQRVATVVMPRHDVTLTAVYQAPNQSPVLTQWSPLAPLASASEGASVVFRATASDASDPDGSARGMVSLTWSVDGVQTKQTLTGAPGEISSTFTLKTDAATVSGASDREVVVKLSALDRQGGVTETLWRVRVTNVPVSQSIAFPALAVRALGAPDFDPGASSSSGLAVLYASGNEAVATVGADGLIRITGAGTAEITASQPGSFDFKAAAPVKRTLTVKAQVEAEVPEGGGAVSGAGLFAPGATVRLTAKAAAGYALLNWEDGTQTATRSFKMPNANVRVQAHFGAISGISAPAVTDPGPLRATVGVTVTQALEVLSGSLPTVTVTGLPAGLKYDAAAKAVTGVPTAPVSHKSVTVTASNAGGTATRVLDFTVEPLPAWAQGSFNGWLEHGELGAGLATLLVTQVGKVTGRLSAAGTNYSFSAGAYARRDSDGAFWVAAEAKSGAKALPVRFKVSQSLRGAGAEWLPETLSAAEGWVGEGTGEPPDAALFRNVWSEAGMAGALTERFVAYYTAALPVVPDPEAPAGSGYLAFTVDKAGAVKTAGRLADGQKVSFSGTLVADGAGRVWTVLYAAPAQYKGGQFFGVAEFVKPADGGPVYVRPLDHVAMRWVSLNPQATAEYGAGFAWQTGLSGGWYDKVGNLYAYYAGKTLTVGTAASAEAPEIAVGESRIAAACWDPSGVTLTPTLTGAAAMTGLSAPAAGKPADADGDGVWNYSATNSVGLKLSLARPTGLFKGSFLAWFDAPGKMHLSKSVSFEGMLTPVREELADGVAGRGFFLWADAAQAPVAGKTYPFSWSYDFQILAGE